MCNPSFSLSTSSSFEPISSSSSSSSSSSYSNNYFRNQRFRKPSLRSMAGLGTTPQKQRSSLFFADENSDYEEPHYFLDSCFRCKTPLHADDDIYMYRGDTPFCTEECRQEQIEIDEAQERKNKSKMSKKNLKTKIDNTSSKSQSHEIHVRAAETTVLAS